MNVAILGASDKPGRYSYKALLALIEKGHTVFPVHQRLKEIDGIKVYPKIANIMDPIDTLTLYVSANISSLLIDEILQKDPKRIIFNPGAENTDLNAKAVKKGIKTLNACTLVLLHTNQF